MGLALCQQIALLMNGQLTVESAVDKGTTMTFSVPLRDPDRSIRSYSESVSTLSSPTSSAASEAES